MKGSKLKLTTKNEQTFPHSNQHKAAVSSLYTN